MTHGPYRASLTTSAGVEVTERVPCDVDLFGRPCADFSTLEHSECRGVAERIVVWCGGCGECVRSYPLAVLVVLDGGVSEGFGTGCVSFSERFHARGQA